MAKANLNDVTGMLLVDKPQDWTSQDVVACMKGRFHLRKIGHCGTLDPLATGLLVVLMGKATKLQDSLMAQDKVYVASMRLGATTDTEDSQGNVLTTSDASGVTEEQVREAMEGFLGEISQVPPMVSAIKRNGKPLYELARKGVVVEREPRLIRVMSLEIVEMSLPDVTFRVHCSKGTYVRTLCADIGGKLGCGAYMTALRRMSSGDHDVKDAYTMDEIKSWELEQLQAHVLAPL